MTEEKYCKWLSAEQRRAADEAYDAVPRKCVVTGGTGFVGQRLVEMLVERGAEEVISYDIVPPHDKCWKHPRIKWVVGDISDVDALEVAFEGADCVWHIAAAVGPFHPNELYDRVNYYGTLNVINVCKKLGVPKIVMSSSPSTRFTGEDIDGSSEDEMPQLPLPSYMQAYAGSKARGEMAMTEACCDSLMTVAIAPHQVYGPRDNLFMPNILEAASTGRLRIFSCARTGNGKNRVCFTHVDNYCHGLIIGEKALYKGSPALGKFYIVTDGSTHTYPEGYGLFWEEIDKPITAMGFDSLWGKVMLPYWFMMIVAYICNVIGFLLGTKLKVNPFNVRVLTMHRWFRIDAAEKELQYEPIIPFAEGWKDNAAWFRTHWLPKFKTAGLTGIYKGSEAKIQIQAGKKTSLD
mmetsp:Transcript_27980/g.78255  ORF Transcript_27980/g.78255 Transcript_27980/m.78255 type:complete len:406 (+) Transcript_27980:70-1287(+)